MGLTADYAALAKQLENELEDTADKLSNVWIALDMVARGQAVMTPWEAEKILRHQKAPGWKDDPNHDEQ